jgi:hypothetical protein
MNFIWGAAKNPWNKLRSIGGSSGGEAGLISTHGSPLGFGSDVGGSLRIPAAFGGCYTLKPTSFRTSSLQILNMEGEDVNFLYFIIIISIFLLTITVFQQVQLVDLLWI